MPPPWVLPKLPECLELPWRPSIPEDPPTCCFRRGGDILSPSPRPPPPLPPVSDRDRFSSDEEEEELLPWEEGGAVLLWKVEEADRERLTHMELRDDGLEEAVWEKEPAGPCWEPGGASTRDPRLRPVYVKLAGWRGFFTPDRDSSLGPSRWGRRACCCCRGGGVGAGGGGGGGGVGGEADGRPLACRRALRSGCRGFRPRFLRTGSGLARRICGRFWGPGWSARGAGLAFLAWSSSSSSSSSSEEDEEGDEERPEEGDEEVWLSLAEGTVS